MRDWPDFSQYACGFDCGCVAMWRLLSDGSVVKDVVQCDGSAHPVTILKVEDAPSP